jgi:DNA-binding FrmR family transcriptional regulator
MSNADAVQRLRSACGHVDAVIRIIEDDRYCIDVIQQIGAVQAALGRSRRAVLEHDLRTCVAEGYAEGRVEEMADALIGAFFGGRVAGTRHCHHAGHGAAHS